MSSSDLKYYKAVPVHPLPRGQFTPMSAAFMRAALRERMEIRHPNPEVGENPERFFSVATDPLHCNTPGPWPCALFEVRPAGTPWVPSYFAKRGEIFSEAVAGFRVVQELPVQLMLGPNSDTLLSLFSETEFSAISDRLNPRHLDASWLYHYRRATGATIRAGRRSVHTHAINWAGTLAFQDLSKAFKEVSTMYRNLVRWDSPAQAHMWNSRSLTRRQQVFYAACGLSVAIVALDLIEPITIISLREPLVSPISAVSAPTSTT